jgi:UDP-glucose 4-epimerase
VLESLRDDTPFTLYGTDYPTEDGTCVRDYVHVQDIADAHVSALYDNLASGVYNLGTNQGTSNAEIIKAATRITGRQLKVVVGNKRDGDPAVLTASADKFGQVYKDWQKYTLDDMITHAWKWYVR